MDTHYFEDGTEDGDGRRTRIVTPSGTYDVTHLMEHARREALKEAVMDDELTDGELKGNAAFWHSIAMSAGKMARARALEEAAKVCVGQLARWWAETGKALPFGEGLPDGDEAVAQCAAAIRALIAKEQ
jgi:hypothetical protein